MRTCLKCGCTDSQACIDTNGNGCYWVEDDLCSECVVNVEEVRRLNQKAFKYDKSPLVDYLQKEKLNHNKHVMRKLIIQAAPLVAALKKVKEVISDKPLDPLHKNLMVCVGKNEMVMTGTDLLVTIAATVPVENDYEPDYEYLLPFAYFHDICENLGGMALTMEFVTTGKKKGITHIATLTTLTDTFVIEGLEETTNFPKMPSFPVENSVGISGEFIDSLNKAIATVSTNKMNSAMEKVSIVVATDGITMASCNSYVAFERHFGAEATQETKLLVSTKIAKALKGLKETSISWSDNHVAFVSDTYRLVGTLQNEKFPNYQGIFHDTAPNLTISHAELHAVMEKVSLTKKHATIYFKREIGRIVVESADEDLSRKVTIRIAQDFPGDCEQIIIDPAQVLLLLGQVKYTNMSLAIKAPNAAIVFTAEADPSYRALAMPMQL